MKLKVFIANILQINLFGKILRNIFNNDIPFHNVKINVSDKAIMDSVVAQLFWRIYESAEIRFVKKYLNQNYDIIELGSSIGAVSSILGKLKHDEKKLYCIEANVETIHIIENNLIKNNVNNFTVINKAIGPLTSDAVRFQKGDTNLLGKISTDDNTMSIPTLSLKDLLLDYSINEFCLVCDIEGAEIYLIKEQWEYLRKAEILIVELHDCEYDAINYNYEELNNLIMERGSFECIDSFGPVFVYKNISLII